MIIPRSLSATAVRNVGLSRNISYPEPWSYHFTLSERWKSQHVHSGQNHNDNHNQEARKSKLPVLGAWRQWGRTQSSPGFVTVKSVLL